MDFAYLDMQLLNSSILSKQLQDKQVLTLIWKETRYFLLILAID